MNNLGPVLAPNNEGLSARPAAKPEEGVLGQFRDAAE
jgi:hypothetical protein